MNASAAPSSALDEQRILGIVARHRDRDGPLIEVLHEVQETFGCIPSGSVAVIARGLNLSRAEVHGVVSFYHHFRTRPPGRHVLQICRAEACQAMGADALLSHAELRLGCASHSTTSDGSFSLEPVYCLGLCASSPALMLDGEPHGRVSARGLDVLIAQARSGK